MKKTLEKYLVALRDNGGTLDNRRLREVAGAELRKPARDELNELGYISSTGTRPVVHALTQAGRDYLDAPRRPSQLTPTQILALVALMAEARQLTNKEFAALAGFSLTGRDNAKLEGLGYVATNRAVKPFAHELTDKGWHLMRTLHESEPPQEGRSAIRTLFSLLANLNRALDRLQVSPGEFFKQVPAEDLQGAIRSAYAALATPPGEWVGLADLRDRLPGRDRSAVDATLRAMLHQPGVRIIPVANIKSLTAADRAAAVRIGGEDSHMIAIEP